jgi:hypothetical protein
VSAQLYDARPVLFERLAERIADAQRKGQDSDRLIYRADEIWNALRAEHMRRVPS